ncbi:MAG TPA: hypothetical protein VEK08_15375 [Planctomycetota bacterium]|nr:hypothetical protein [Planctomycetota bacterium]
MELNDRTSQQQVEQKLITIISKQLDVPPEKITPESEIVIGGELPFDSLEIAEFYMNAESAFDLTLSDDAHEKAFPGARPTVRSVATLIMRARNQV